MARGPWAGFGSAASGPLRLYRRGGAERINRPPPSSKKVRARRGTLASGPTHQFTRPPQLQVPSLLKADMVQEGVTWVSWEGVLTVDQPVPVGGAQSAPSQANP